MTVISDVLRGPYGDIQPNVIITMQAKGTTARVLTSNRSSTVTDAAGKYSMTVFPGEYEVTVSTLGHVGDIKVLTDSVNGTLNDFLISPPKPDELTPEVVRTVDTMRAETAASAAAAKTSENNAAAAMANALSKTVTTAQSVAGSVTFNKGLIGIGAVDAKAISSTNNPVIRFMTDTDVEKVAIIAEQDPVGIQIRWSGKAQSALFYNDGTVRFPGVVQSGTTALMKTGEYGVGGYNSIIPTSLDNVSPNQFIGAPQGGTTGAPTAGSWAGLQGGLNSVNRWELIFAQELSALDIRARTRNYSGNWTAYSALWHSTNTTVDANGFIKKASPIVKLFGDGQCVLNDESQGVTTERISVGVYRVSGVLGFNGDGAWGGAGNGIEIPVDDNKRPLIWVESKVLPDGDIEIRTCHRTYDTGPYSARNIEAMDSGEVDKKKLPIFVEMPDGTPIDIPAGRWIDLRVEMPASDEPEYEPVPEDEAEPEVTPDVTEPEDCEEPAPGEVPAPIEEPKE